MSTNPFADVTSFEELNELFQTRLQTWAVECTKRHECIQLTVRYLEACKPFIAGFARQQLQVRNRDEFERVLLILKDSETGDDFRTVRDVIFPSGGRESLLWYNPIQLDTLAGKVLDKLMRGVRIPMVQQQVQVGQQTPEGQIDDELNRALQELLPSSGIEEEYEYRPPVVGADKINARKLAAAVERSLEDQDVEMQRAMEESMLEQAIEESMLEQAKEESMREQAMEEAMLAEALRLSLEDQVNDFMQE
jgi:hypothetical protein